MTGHDPAEHRELRESLGAWVLGALDGDQRRRVQAHVAACPTCAEEVAALSPLPGLLNRLSEEEVADDLLVPSQRLRKALASDVERADARMRRDLSRWRKTALVAGVAAVLALVVAVVGLVGNDAQEEPEFDRIFAAAAPVSADAADTSGEAAALAWEWGSTVELDVDALPARDAYVLWAVAEDGTREQAGTWGVTQSRSAIVRGASSIQRDDLAAVEVTDADGTVLVRFAFTD